MRRPARTGALNGTYPDILERDRSSLKPKIGPKNNFVTKPSTWMAWRSSRQYPGERWTNTSKHTYKPLSTNHTVASSKAALLAWSSELPRAAGCWCSYQLCHSWSHQEAWWNPGAFAETQTTNRYKWTLAEHFQFNLSLPRSQTRWLGRWDPCCGRNVPWTCSSTQIRQSSLRSLRRNYKGA